MNFDAMLTVSLGIGLIIGIAAIYFLWSNWTPPDV